MKNRASDYEEADFTFDITSRQGRKFPLNVSRPSETLGAGGTKIISLVAVLQSNRQALVDGNIKLKCKRNHNFLKLIKDKVCSKSHID